MLVKNNNTACVLKWLKIVNNFKQHRITKKHQNKLL